MLSYCDEPSTFSQSSYASQRPFAWVNCDMQEQGMREAPLRGILQSEKGNELNDGASKHL